MIALSVAFLERGKLSGGNSVDISFKHFLVEVFSLLMWDDEDNIKNSYGSYSSFLCCFS